jgi:hypothetical protein
MVPMMDIHSTSDSSYCNPLYSQSASDVVAQKSSMNDAAATPFVNVDSPAMVTGQCRPVSFHWFYCKNVDLRQIWQPFSQRDSDNMEATYQKLNTGVSSLCLSSDFMQNEWLQKTDIICSWKMSDSSLQAEVVVTNSCTGVLQITGLES